MSSELGLRDVRKSLLRKYPQLLTLARIGRARGAFYFRFRCHGFEPCLGGSCCSESPPEEASGVRLWHTDIVVLYPNRATMVDTGGHRTYTTKKYMKWLLTEEEIEIGSDRGEWMLFLPRWKALEMDYYFFGGISASIPLEDGMIV